MPSALGMCLVVPAQLHELHSKHLQYAHQDSYAKDYELLSFSNDGRISSRTSPLSYLGGTVSPISELVGDLG